NPESHIMPLRIKGETEQALARLPGRTVMLRPGGVRPVAGTGTRHGLLKPLYVLGGPLMQLAGAALPSMVTSNLSLGRAMIALARMDDPPAVVECAQINQLGDADAA
ncbi:MAG TPA: oxidoreductase, partial [Stenotrophomonas sp.]